MAMTWAAGDSQPERFETARGSYVACHAARKRPGTTLEGFQKAVSRAPPRRFRALAAGVRQEIRARFAGRLLVDGFEPVGCDGSRIECPRTVELGARLGRAGKDDAAPTVRVTAFVHLATGLLWSWQLGPGTAAEQVHLRRSLEALSPQALIVRDAAYMGYELVRAIVATDRSFLFRMSSKVHLYTPDEVAIKDWTEGRAWYWPKSARAEGRAPLACRLIRAPARGKVKHDVWLLTDVLDPARLSAATAAKFYRWRWRNEGVFRTYKRTIHKVKRSGRTVRLVHREAEVSLLATPILLAHADLALRPTATVTAGEPVISPRQVLIEIRRELKGTESRRAPSYRDRLRGCRADDRKQTSPKASREWPRRKPHEPPKPPILHTPSTEQKVLLNQHRSAGG
ncbi:MAG TPA: transposase [Gemmataceae bacterium]|nr:transposase [Gemmataceae bacterium]